MPIDTTDVFLAAQKKRALLRSDYIRLRGTDVLLRRNMRKTERIDEYGDVINTENTWVTFPVKIVIDLSQFYSMVINMESGSNEFGITPIKALVDLDLDVIPGDRIRFSKEVIAGLKEDKELVVGDVLQQVHVVAISKYITLVPLRDI
nr:MAG TPA: hypothetical protein [Caudoviricetes sp.]